MALAQTQADLKAKNEALVALETQLKEQLVKVEGEGPKETSVDLNFEAFFGENPDRAKLKECGAFEEFAQWIKANCKPSAPISSPQPPPGAASESGAKAEEPPEFPMGSPASYLPTDDDAKGYEELFKAVAAAKKGGQETMVGFLFRSSQKGQADAWVAMPQDLVTPGCIRCSVVIAVQ